MQRIEVKFDHQYPGLGGDDSLCVYCYTITALDATPAYLPQGACGLAFPAGTMITTWSDVEERTWEEFLTQHQDVTRDDLTTIRGTDTRGQPVVGKVITDATTAKVRICFVAKKAGASDPAPAVGVKYRSGVQPWRPVENAEHEEITKVLPGPPQR